MGCRKRVIYGLVGMIGAASGQAQLGAAPLALPVIPITTACSVVDMTPDETAPGVAGMLLASCGEHSMLLGPAAAYSTASNAASGSVLVIRKRDGRTSVLLIAPLAGATGVHVDDITRDLVILSGRAGDLGLGEIKVDASRFSVDGSVGVAREGIVKRLDLVDYLGRAAAIKATLVQAPSNTNAAGD